MVIKATWDDDDEKEEDEKETEEEKSSAAKFAGTGSTEQEAILLLQKKFLVLEDESNARKQELATLKEEFVDSDQRWESRINQILDLVALTAKSLERTESVMTDKIKDYTPENINLILRKQFLDADKIEKLKQLCYASYNSFNFMTEQIRILREEMHKAALMTEKELRTK